jgi:hypothetical protein
MKVELSRHEIELIDKALECWERDACHGALFSMMVGTMLAPPGARTAKDRL